MIGGFDVVGQSSIESGTPSASMSSFFTVHPPDLTTPSVLQVSPPQMSEAPPVHCAPVVQMFPPRLQVLMQVQLPLLLWQALFGSSWQMPLVGHWASVEQIVALVRLQEPAKVPVNVTGCAPLQSPSHASPIPSLSVSAWFWFGVLTQLSSRSLTVSPSRSACASQAAPLPPCPGTWSLS